MKKWLAIFILLILFSNAWGSVMTDMEANLQLAEMIGVSCGLPVGLGEAIAWRESKGDSKAVGKNNTDKYSSRGLFQINERYEKWLADTYFDEGGGSLCFDVWDPTDNAMLGCTYMNSLYKRFGDWRLALWAYNWGPENVKKAMISDTRRTISMDAIPARVLKYASDILNRMENYKDLTKEINSPENIIKRQIQTSKIILANNGNCPMSIKCSDCPADARPTNTCCKLHGWNNIQDSIDWFHIWLNKHDNVS